MIRQSIFRHSLLMLLAALASVCARAQQPLPDSVAAADSLPRPIAAEDRSVAVEVKPRQWIPSAKKALWLSLIPGAGQMYNRKFWKLPIVYGAFTGCAYAIRWNGMMYSDYKQAYIDITDDDPTTDSYNKFLHLGSEVTPENESRWKELFRKRKDYFRRYRDMSIIITVAVYTLSIIDAYVDASLSDFDITPDLSLHIAPTIINGTPGGNALTQNTWQPLRSKAFGLACIISF